MALDHSCQVVRAPLAEHLGDRYDTPEVAVRALLAVECLPARIWEPACGRGNIVRVLRAAGHEVVATDIADRGCPDSESGVDFLLLGGPRVECDAIVTNPPYSLVDEFAAAALERAALVIMLLRFAWFEGVGRTDIVEGGKLARVRCLTPRIPMMHREGWAGRKSANSGMAMAWYVWDRAHHGPTTLDRIHWREHT